MGDLWETMEFRSIEARGNISLSLDRFPSGEIIARMIPLPPWRYK